MSKLLEIDLASSLMAAVVIYVIKCLVWNEWNENVSVSVPTVWKKYVLTYPDVHLHSDYFVLEYELVHENDSQHVKGVLRAWVSEQQMFYVCLFVKKWWKNNM